MSCADAHGGHHARVRENHCSGLSVIRQFRAFAVGHVQVIVKVEEVTGTCCEGVQDALVPPDHIHVRVHAWREHRATLGAGAMQHYPFIAGLIGFCALAYAGLYDRAPANVRWLVGLAGASALLMAVVNS
jgi:hypothetical protein